MSFPALKEEDKPKENNPQSANPFLDKEQKRFYASQWKEQLYLQIMCGMQREIKIDTATYKNKAISESQEREINKLFSLLQAVTTAYDVTLQSMTADPKNIDIEKLKLKIDELQTEIDKADSEYFCKCAEVFYAIPKDVALANKEMLSPYIAGRNYLRDLRVIGNTYNAIQDSTVTPRLLKKLVDIITERHYS